MFMAPKERSKPWNPLLLYFLDKWKLFEPRPNWERQKWMHASRQTKFSSFADGGATQSVGSCQRHDD